VMLRRARTAPGRSCRCSPPPPRAEVPGRIKPVLARVSGADVAIAAALAAGADPLLFGCEVSRAC
jgi:hypothetical protein